MTENWYKLWESINYEKEEEQSREKYLLDEVTNSNEVTRKCISSKKKRVIGRIRRDNHKKRVLKRFLKYQLLNGFYGDCNRNEQKYTGFSSAYKTKWLSDSEVPFVKEFQGRRVGRGALYSKFGYKNIKQNIVAITHSKTRNDKSDFVYRERAKFKRMGSVEKRLLR